MIRGNSCLSGKVKCKYESIQIYVISKVGVEYWSQLFSYLLSRVITFSGYQKTNSESK